MSSSVLGNRRSGPARSRSASPTTASCQLAGTARIDLLEERKLALIAETQTLGGSWEEVGRALVVTRQAAWEKYRRRVRDMLERSAASATYSEEELLDSAADVLRAVRRRRGGT